MLKDQTETTTEAAPIIQFLERREAQNLLLEDSPIHPEYLNSPELKVDIDTAGNIIGTYPKDSEGVEIIYEAERFSCDFACNIKAPLSKWLQWPPSIRKDFVDKIKDSVGEKQPAITIERTLQYKSRKRVIGNNEPSYEFLGSKIFLGDKFITISRSSTLGEIHVDTTLLSPPINYPYL